MNKMKSLKILNVEITSLGVVLALKNLGTWLATMTFLEVYRNPLKFCWLLLIYVLINVPSDLLLMNHASKQKEVT